MEHCKYLEQQFLNEKTADVIFVLNNGEQISAHKSILAASSQKFQRQFNEIVHLKKIEINNITSAAFREFLYTFYQKHPEKHRFSMENIVSVLQLARVFDADFCTGTAEQFLVRNLTSDQMCLGFCIAYEFQLAKLKVHCWQQIDEKEAEAFPWDICFNWVQVQCGKSNVGSSKIGEHLATLSKHFGDNNVKNEDAQTYAKQQHCKDHVASNSLMDSQPHRAEIEGRNQFMFVRLLDKMLATQICSITDAPKIELKCTKEIILSGVAFSTVSGSPRGKLSVSFCRDEGESLLAVQNFNLTPKSCEPRNFIAIGDGIVLKPNQKYSIRVELQQDVVFYRSYTAKNHFSQNDLNVSLTNYKPDIFSHLLFNV